MINCKLPARPQGHYAPIYDLLWAISELTRNYSRRLGTGYRGIQKSKKDQRKSNTNNKAHRAERKPSRSTTA